MKTWDIKSMLTRLELVSLGIKIYTVRYYKSKKYNGRAEQLGLQVKASQLKFLGLSD